MTVRSAHQHYVEESNIWSGGDQEPAAEGHPLPLPSPVPVHAVPISAATIARRVDDSINAKTRAVVLSLRQLGASGPMMLRGSNQLQGLQFSIRPDEVVTSAQLSLAGATSPLLIPELSHLTVTLNELAIGTVPVVRERPEYQLTLPVNPRLFRSNTNRLNFRFTGRYTQGCNDPRSGISWATISESSTLTLQLERLPAQRSLGRLPLPLLDVQERGKLVLPFVLPTSPDDDTLKAAAVVASWLGNLAATRIANFPALTEPPLEGNAIMFVTGANASVKGAELPPVTGPTLALVANPNDAFGSLLVIAGRTPQETETAAEALVVGGQTSGDAPVAMVGVPAAASRVPYDAPNWIPTTRPVKLSELVEVSSLHRIGYGGLIHVPFHMAPDLYTWRSQPFLLNLLIHPPAGADGELARSRLDVTMNDIYLRTLPLAEPRRPSAELARLLGREDAHQDRQIDLPPYSVSGQNDLQLYFDAGPMAIGDCVEHPNNLLMAVDPESTIDFSRGYRVARLPNLAFFANSGFPFTRMADLSDTAIVLPRQLSGMEISAFLTLMGRVGAITGYPVTRVAVTRPEHVKSFASRDLLVMGTLEHLGDAGGLLVKSPIQQVGNRLTVSVSNELGSGRQFRSGQTGDMSPAAAMVPVELTRDWGALIGLENPLHSGRSLVALLGATPRAVDNVVVALDDPDKASLIQGDLTLVIGEQPVSYRIGSTFTFGDLPIWLWPYWLLGDRIWPVVLAVSSGFLVVGFFLYRATRWSRRLLRNTARRAI